MGAALVRSITNAGDVQVLQAESLAAWRSLPVRLGALREQPLPLSAPRETARARPVFKFYQTCRQWQPWRRKAEGSRASKASCLGRALRAPSLWIRYLCCRGLHRSSSFPCSIPWRALSNGGPTCSQPQESSTKQRTLWIWWLRISGPCSGCLWVQKIFHC